MLQPITYIHVHKTHQNMQKLKQTFTDLPSTLQIHSDIVSPIMFHSLLVPVETH